MLQISQLFIYPIKSLGGIAVKSAEVTDRGFKYDRRWMLVDENNRFLSQREIAAMALFKVAVGEQGLVVTYNNSSIDIPFQPKTDDIKQVSVWDDTCSGIVVSTEINQWFTSALGFKCSLVYMPDNSLRKVEEDYAKQGEITSFSDAYPFLIIGQASLDDLNSRLQDKISIDRFRPNIVFTGGMPFQEDTLHHFTINEINFFGVKPCARCVVITIDQQTAAKGTEPLRALAAYRNLKKGNVYFGQNLLHKGVGSIRVGDGIYLEVK